MTLPITESDTIHAAQAELERLIASHDMAYLRPDTRALLSLMVIQSARFARICDDVHDIERRLTLLDGNGWHGEEE